MPMNIIKFLTLPIVPNQSGDEQTIRYWREQIFFILCTGSLWVGTIVYIISMYFAIISNLHFVVILDTFVYILALIIFTVRSIPFQWRVNLFLFILYLLGVGLLISVGKSGAGYPWLFALPVFAGILMSKRGAIILLATNILTLVALYFFIGMDLPENMLIQDYGKEEYIVTVFNFIGINGIITLSLLILIEGLTRSLNREKWIIRSLKKQQRKLVSLKEKAEESERLKSAFLANISHEIRTPLNAIMGFSDLISRDRVPEDNKKKYAEIITTKGEVLLNLINDLIDVSMIESGQLKIRKKKTDPQSIMEELYLSGQQLLHQYEKDHIDLRNNTNEQNLSEFHTDPYRLQQILSNLLQNAIKYTTHGTIELGCELQNEGRQLLFYVKDTGIGIPEEKKAYVFQRFTQLANKDGVTEGTGLGLAISGSLAELLGGTIDFKSDQHGTLFYVILPYKE